MRGHHVDGSCPLADPCARSRRSAAALTSLCRIPGETLKTGTEGRFTRGPSYGTNAMIGGERVFRCVRLSGALPPRWGRPLPRKWFDPTPRHVERNHNAVSRSLHRTELRPAPRPVVRGRDLGHGIQGEHRYGAGRSACWFVGNPKRRRLPSSSQLRTGRRCGSSPPMSGRARLSLRTRGCPIRLPPS